MPETERLRLYADQLRGLADFLDTMPDTMGGIGGFGYDSWFDVADQGLVLRDAKNDRPISVNWDGLTENWYVEVGDA